MRHFMMFLAMLAACGGGGEALRQEPQCRLVRIDWDYDADGTPDEREFITYLGGLVERRETVRADGQPISVTITYFDSEGRVVREDNDQDADGIIDVVTRSTYDADGNPVRREVEWPANRMGDIVFVLRYTHPSAFTTVVETDGDGDGRSDYTEILTVDADGRLIRKEIDYTAVGSAGEIWSYAYDADGRLLRETVDADRDGVVDVLMHYSYDASGNPAVKRIDSDADGVVDILVEAVYDCS